MPSATYSGRLFVGFVCIAMLSCSGNADNDEFASQPEDTGVDIVDTGTNDVQVDRGPDLPVEVCGDGILHSENDEACDGTDLGGATCLDQGFDSGTLQCADDCSFDTSGCQNDPGPLCGNGVLEDGEECDGADFGELTCADYFFDFGRLTCLDTCEISVDACNDVPVCGDGEREGVEECDDGNNVDEDGCAFDCLLESCGDGIVQTALGEECDTGGVLSFTCDDVAGRPVGIVQCTDCAFSELVCPDLEFCGDGNLDLGESCDDGNNEAGDGCSPECLSETCGNGTLETTEFCDGALFQPEISCGLFGFPVGDVSCDANCIPNIEACRFATCGDGIVEGGEACDDGNNVSGDGCDRRCRLEGCGDGVWQPELGEQCDGSDILGLECEEYNYGGGFIECGEGCRLDFSNCLPLPECGDGSVDAGEECDDGNTDDFDGCSSACLDETCGDGIVQPDEDCEPALVVTESCRGLGFDRGDVVCTAECVLDTSDCVTAVCGDGTVTEPELCDDGNTVVEDCEYGEVCEVCGPECTPVPGRTSSCGDGVRDADFEECDDGNTVDEPCPYGFLSCTVCGSECARTPGSVRLCGDGVVDTADGEVCDDGNLRSGDGCRSDCLAIEVCGNGVVDAGEDCDDGAANSDTAPDACRTDCSSPRCGDGVNDSTKSATMAPRTVRTRERAASTVSPRRAATGSWTRMRSATTPRTTTTTSPEHAANPASRRSAETASWIPARSAMTATTSTSTAAPLAFPTIAGALRTATMAMTVRSTPAWTACARRPSPKMARPAATVRCAPTPTCASPVSVSALRSIARLWTTPASSAPARRRPASVFRRRGRTARPALTARCARHRTSVCPASAVELRSAATV